MLERIKELLKIKDNDKDMELEFYIELTTQAVLDETYQDELNQALELLVIRVVIELYKKNNNAGTNTDDSSGIVPAISSIKRGDTTISYAIDSTSNINSLSDDEAISYLLNNTYKSTLNRWRKIRGLS